MVDQDKRISTGITGLDKILAGGLIPEDAYLIRGKAGTGKTTLGLHYLCEDLKKEEDVLFISLSEPESKIIRNASKRNFPMEEVNFLDLSPDSDFVQGEDYNIFPSEEVEKAPLLQDITEKIKSIKPKRVFIDGLTQLRYLSTDNYQFRKNIQSLIKLMLEFKTTPLIVSEIGSQPDDDLQFVSDGVINLFFNEEERKINISKIRGSDFQKGYHTYVLDKEGMTVYPKFDSNTLRKDLKRKNNEIISSGVPEIDKLLHGGIERGTNTIITGPTGSGKTSLGLNFMKEAAGRGERSVVYLFEENKEVLLKRSQSINIPVEKMTEKNSLELFSIDQLNLSPEIFIHQVKNEVEKNDTDIVMIDSVTSFSTSFLSSNWNKVDLIKSLNSLRNYLINRNVTVIMTNEIPNITGDLQVTDDKISFLADNIILLRYLEVKGSIQKAIGVLKKRLSSFETRLREFKITEYGLEVGVPLENFRGILTGNPEIINENKKEQV